MPKADKLTPKQEAFVREYILTGNGVQSAKKAGYKGNEKTLSAVAVENLAKPLVIQELNKNRAIIQKKFEINRDELLQIADSIARGTLDKIMYWDRERAEFVPRSDIDPKDLHFIDGLEVSEKYEEVPNENFGGELENGEPDERRTVWKLMKKYKVSTLGKQKLDAIRLLLEASGQLEGKNKEQAEAENALADALRELDEGK